MKTILVLLDGLNYRVAHDAMGYLQAECAAGRGRLYLLESELPSLPGRCMNASSPASRRWRAAWCTTTSRAFLINKACFITRAPPG